MKGVIVQVGEPKSIVLFNNGKIGAIPTPADCHVGMVVSVKLNNRLKIIALSLAAVLLVALGVFIGTAIRGNRPPPAQPPFPIMPASPTMPGHDNGHGRMMMERRRQVQAVTVQEAFTLPDDSRVLIRGTIVESLGDKKYILRDPSGEITVEIDKKLWRDVSAEATDPVEISGEVDVEKRRIVIDVKSLRKL